VCAELDNKDRILRLSQCRLSSGLALQEFGDSCNDSPSFTLIQAPVSPSPLRTLSLHLPLCRRGHNPVRPIHRLPFQLVAGLRLDRADDAVAAELREPPPNQTHGLLNLRFCWFDAGQLEVAAANFSGAKGSPSLDQDFDNCLALATRDGCLGPRRRSNHRSMRTLQLSDWSGQRHPL
jgi:hypothetical protein